MTMDKLDFLKNYLRKMWLVYFQNRKTIGLLGIRSLYSSSRFPATKLNQKGIHSKEKKSSLIINGVAK